MTEQLTGGIYDHPKYYDVLYSTSWTEERRFLEACFLKYARGKVRRVFEPACGTGRLMWRLAETGYEVCGLDLNPNAVDYCNKRLSRHGFAPVAVQGDMSAFRPGDLTTGLSKPQPFDAAFNLIGSFTHLLGEREAVDHLRCVANVLRPGGLYILGFHLIPQGQADCDRECWTATKGMLRLTADLQVVERNMVTRLDTVSFRLRGETPTGRFILDDRFPMRNYTVAQFAALLRTVGRFTTLAVHDFRFDVSAPITVDGNTEDVVYVLQVNDGA